MCELMLLVWDLWTKRTWKWEVFCCALQLMNLQSCLGLPLVWFGRIGLGNLALCISTAAVIFLIAFDIYCNFLNAARLKWNPFSVTVTCPINVAFCPSWECKALEAAHTNDLNISVSGPGVVGKLWWQSLHHPYLRSCSRAKYFHFQGC